MERQYKDSGIEWIGKIPQTWEVDRFKNKFKTGKGLNINKGNLIPEGIPVVSYGQVHSKMNSGTHLDDFLVRYIPPILTVGGESSKVGVGDFIFADTSEDIDGCGNAVYVDREIGLYAGYHSVIAFAKNPEQSKYFAYLFLTECWRSQIRMRVTGIKVFSISQAILNQTTIILPPLAEQQRIAKYLDEKCMDICSLIKLQEQMIEKLKAYKQSIITETVTKGLDTNAKLVPSGIDWIGEVPEGWEEAPLKTILFRRSEKNNPVKTKERLSLSIDKGVTLYAEKTTNLDRFKEDFTQYQLAYPNDIVLNSMNMIVGAVGLSHFYGCVSPVYYVVYSKSKDTDIRYYSYLLNTQIIRDVYHSLGQGIYAIERGEGRVNTCRLKVSYDDFGVIRIPIPPVSEQHAIVSYLDVKCSEIDKLIAVKKQKVEKLKEYKKSVIYEAVTGKTSFAVS